MAGDPRPIPLSLWVVVFFVLQHAFSSMPPPHQLPPATDDATGPSLSWETGSISVNIEDNSKDRVDVFTVPIGQGDSTVIVCPTGTREISIIDMGCFGGCADMSISGYVEAIEKGFLEGSGYKRVKRVFLTHPDVDHFNYGYDGKGNGLLEKFASRWVQGDGKLDVYLGNLESWIWEQSDFADFLNSPPFNIRNDAQWEAVNGIVKICPEPDATIKIIASDLGMTKNDQSMIMSLRINNIKKMLFLGDFESSYNNLLKMSDPVLYKYIADIRDHDIVMVPHHGAASNGNPNVCFYDLVQPRYAIVSSDIQAQLKHPKMETLQAICRTETDVVEPNYPNNDPNGNLKPLGWIKFAGNDILQELQKCDVKIYQTYTATGTVIQPYYIVSQISSTTTDVWCEVP